MGSGGTSTPSDITSAPSPLERHAPPHALKERVHFSWRGDRGGAPSERTLQEAEGNAGTCRRGRRARNQRGRWRGGGSVPELEQPCHHPPHDKPATTLLLP